MALVAGSSRPLRRLSDTVQDPKLRAAIVELETKVDEVDRRLFEVELRIKAGGL